MQKQSKAFWHNLVSGIGGIIHVSQSVSQFLASISWEFWEVGKQGLFIRVMRKLKQMVTGKWQMGSQWFLSYDLGIGQ